MIPKDASTRAGSCSMAPNQQSRWECSRRRGGTTHRGSRIFCAAALKFRYKIFLRMSSSSDEQFEFSLEEQCQLLYKQVVQKHKVTLQNFQPEKKGQQALEFIELDKNYQKHKASLRQIQRIYTKLEEPEKLRNLKAEGALSQAFALLPEKTFRNFLHNPLRIICIILQTQIRSRISKKIQILPSQLMLQLDEKYFQIWHKVWQPNPFEMVASVMSDKGFRQKYKQRNAEEVFCWLAYLNFSLIYQKSQAIIRIKNQNKKDPVEGDDDYAGPTGDKFQEGNKPKQEAETYELFIQKFFHELLGNSAAPDDTDLISALNVVALYILIWEDTSLNKKVQAQNLSKNSRDTLLQHLKCFQVVIKKVKVAPEAESYRTEFSRVIEILTKKLGEDMKNQ